MHHERAIGEVWIGRFQQLSRYCRSLQVRKGGTETSAFQVWDPSHRNGGKLLIGVQYYACVWCATASDQIKWRLWDLVD